MGGGGVTPTPCADTDRDGVCDDADICRAGANSEDTDGDGKPNACDPCPALANEGSNDFDGDNIPDACDTRGASVAIKDGPVMFVRLGETRVTDPVVDVMHPAGPGSFDSNRATAGVQSTTVPGIAGMADDRNPAAGFPGTDSTAVVMFHSQDIPALDSYFPTTAFTFEFWARLGSSKSYHTLLSYAVPAQDDEIALTVNFGDAYIQINRNFINTSFRPTVGVWTHYAWTWDSATGATRLLVNGAQVYAGTLVQGHTIRRQGALTLGMDQDSVGGSFVTADALHGKLDEVLVFDKVLTDERIVAHRDALASLDPCDGVDNDNNGTIDDGITLGERACTPASCNQLLTRKPGTASGIYPISPSGVGGIDIMDATCDMQTDNGGWTLVLNYLHQGGTNPALAVLTNRLPLATSATLGADESGASSAWGHAGNALMNTIAFAETRFYGVTSGHSRVLHFKTQSDLVRTYIKTGVGSMATTSSNGIFDRGGQTTLLGGHTAGLPLLTSPAQGIYYSNQGDQAMTEFPFYLPGAVHWGIRGTGTRWEVDDYNINSSNNTQHQVWVR